MEVGNKVREFSSLDFRLPYPARPGVDRFFTCLKLGAGMARKGPLIGAEGNVAEVLAETQLGFISLH
jgi:hypothetical protein